MEVSNKILSTIEEKRLEPTARWYFRFKRTVFWLLAFATLTLGVFAFSLVQYLVVNQDWDLYAQNYKNIWQFMWLATPFAWIALFVIFVVAVYLNIKKSRHGYKYKPAWIVVVCLTVSIGLGSLVSSAGAAERIHDIFSASIPAYTAIFDTTTKVWNRPAQGFLGGKIVKIESEKDLVIEDAKKQEWMIIITPETKIHKNVVFKLDKKIKIIGSIQSDKSFKADQIRPWKNNRLGFRIRQTDRAQRLRNKIN